MKRPVVGTTLCIALAVGAGCASRESAPDDADRSGSQPEITTGREGTSDSPGSGTIDSAAGDTAGDVSTVTSTTFAADTTTTTTATTTTTTPAVPSTAPATPTTTDDPAAGPTADTTPGTATTPPPAPSTTTERATTDSDDADPGEPTAAEAVDATEIEAAYALLTSSLDVSAGDVPLADCPLDPDDTIVPALFGSLELGDADGVAGLPVVAGAFDVGGGYGTMIYCDRFPDVGDEGVGVFAIPTPDDFEAYTSVFADPDGSARIGIDVAPLRDDEQGGELVRICVTAADDPGLDYCEIDWAIGAVTIGAYVNGALTRSVDLGAFEAAFVERAAALAAELVAA